MADWTLLLWRRDGQADFDALAAEGFRLLSLFREGEAAFETVRARTRAKPAFRASSRTFRCSPFFPRITGARMRKRVPSSRPITWSTIWSMVWRRISLPHLGQWGTPTRAHSRRR